MLTTMMPMVIQGLIFLGIIVNAFANLRTMRLTRKVEISINSRMTELLKTTTEAAHGAGMAQARKEILIDPAAVAEAAAKILEVAQEAAKELKPNE